MVEPPIEIADIVKLAARAGRELDACFEMRNREEEERTRRGELALVAAARLAGHASALGLVADVRRWSRGSPLYDEPSSPTWDLLGALVTTARAGLSLEQLERLASTLSDSQLARLIPALDPERGPDLEILRRLTDDRRAKVADAAALRLGSLHVHRWHAGVFETDPIVEHEGDAAIVDALGRARDALGRADPRDEPEHPSALCAAVGSLPPALARPLLEASALTLTSLAKPKPEDVEAGASPIARLHALGGLDAVAEVTRRIVTSNDAAIRALADVSPWYLVLPEGERVELALRLLDWLEWTPDDPSNPYARPPRELSDQHQALALFVFDLWPPARMPMEVIEWLTQDPRSSMFALIAIRGGIKNSTAALEPHAARLIELVLAKPSLRRDLSKLYERLAESAPLDQLTSLVEGAEASKDSGLQAWAFELRLGRLAPTTPEGRDALARDWLSDDARRKSILGSALARTRLLPWLRRRLRAGEANLDEANATLSAIGEVYGGVVVREGSRLDAPVSELVAAERRATLREQLGAWIDAPKGPPSSAEWATLRALTHDALASKGAHWSVLRVTPTGPWQPEDLAILDALEARAVPGTPMGMLHLHHLGTILDRGSPPPDLGARASRLITAWAPDEASDELLDLSVFRRLATGADDRARDRPAQPTSTIDWMDEEDER